ncbi:hypothetical protein NDU88_002861 [Pleurodeles waltl]|uniref:Uncharacterized protein n=1 Tax=Pleurodeles waltl TaxID=8319 RepID=A0AAV7SFY0_PLEWA|nr:hypothetical protein NDU88_002861 [Pleurodeles waltl]
MPGTRGPPAPGRGRYAHCAAASSPPAPLQPAASGDCHRPLRVVITAPCEPPSPQHPDTPSPHLRLEQSEGAQTVSASGSQATVTRIWRDRNGGTMDSTAGNATSNIESAQTASPPQAAPVTAITDINTPQDSQAQPPRKPPPTDNQYHLHFNDYYIDITDASTPRDSTTVTATTNINTQQYSHGQPPLISPPTEPLIPPRQELLLLQLLPYRHQILKPLWAATFSPPTSIPPWIVAVLPPS